MASALCRRILLHGRAARKGGCARPDASGSPVNPSSGGETPAPRRGPAIAYGWVVVAALSVTETISWGIIYYSFPVFLRAMEIDLGASRVGVTGALSAALAVSALAALPAGRWLDRYGPRALMTAGSCLGAVLVLAWSRVGSLAALYAVWCAMGLAMAATLYEPAFAAVVQWFSDQRDRALLIVTLAAGLASTIFMPLAAWLLGRFGWRTAAELLAIFLAVTTIPIHALVLRAAHHESSAPREAAPQAGASVLLRGALGSAVFWALAAAFAVGVFASVTVTVHLIPYLTQHGYPAAYAAAVVGWIGAMQLLGRALFAPIAAWFGPRVVTGAVFAAQGAAMALIPVAVYPPGLVPVIVLLGSTNGMSTLARATAVAEIFGRRNYASISGAIAAGANGARALGPVGASLLMVWLGSYERVFWGLAGALLIASLALLVTESRAAAGKAVRSP